MMASACCARFSPAPASPAPKARRVMTLVRIVIPSQHQDPAVSREPRPSPRWRRLRATAARQSTATAVISTRRSGSASRASTQARAGGFARSTQAS